MSRGTDGERRGDADGPPGGGTAGDGKPEREAIDGDPVRRHRGRTLWVSTAVALLGVWLVFAPATFGYGDAGQVSKGVERITAERELRDVVTRGTWVTWSDIVSGLLLVVLAVTPRRFWAAWAACIVGLWVLVAPLLLWAPDDTAYLNGLVVGALVRALTVLIRGMPGMVAIMQMGREQPPGWRYNPSSWLQRTPVVALAWPGSVRFIGSPQCRESSRTDCWPAGGTPPLG